jgi:hypothetical protein
MAELDKEVSQAAQDAKPPAAPQVTPDGKLEGVAANAQEATAALRALVDRIRPFVRVPAVPDVVPGAYDEVEGLKAPLLAADGAAALAEALAATAGVATADRALGCVVTSAATATRPPPCAANSRAPSTAARPCPRRCSTSSGPGTATRRRSAPCCSGTPPTTPPKRRSPSSARATSERPVC